MGTHETWHYEGLRHWGPLSEQAVEDALDHLTLRPEDRVVDLGCGGGELLLRLVERFGVSAVGVDHAADALERVREQAAQRVPDRTVETLCCSVGELSGWDELGCVACVGGPRVADTVDTHLAKLATWLRPGGALVVGEGFWCREPDPAYLEATGIPRDDLPLRDELAALVAQSGLEERFWWTAERSDWDRFESTLLENWRARAAACSDDAGLAETLAAKERFHAAQERWGRETMGFALFVLRAPG